MKKHYLLVLFALTWCLPVWSQLRGDLNGDNQVDVSDVNIMIDMVLGKQAQDISEADLDGNNIIDVSDVNAIIDIVLGKDPSGGDEPGIQTFTVNGVSFKMVQVQGGKYTMGVWGQHEEDGVLWDTEEWAMLYLGAGYDYCIRGPYVQVSTFSIGQTEVTQELWMAVMSSNPSYCNGMVSSELDFGTNIQRPVEQVSWEDCQLFISQLNSLTGLKFRLPTEAEWEFAALGGRKSMSYDTDFYYFSTYRYSGSNNINEVAWYLRSPSDSDNTSVNSTHTVGTKASNELGLYDMSGNVFEWCQDWHTQYYNWYGSESPKTGIERACRGGSWDDERQYCISKYRLNRQKPDERSKSIGLRLAL